MDQLLLPNWGRHNIATLPAIGNMDPASVARAYFVILGPGLGERTSYYSYDSSHGLLC